MLYSEATTGRRNRRGWVYFSVRISIIKDGSKGERWLGYRRFRARRTKNKTISQGYKSSCMTFAEILAEEVCSKGQKAGWNEASTTTSIVPLWNSWIRVQISRTTHFALRRSGVRNLVTGEYNISGNISLEGSVKDIQRIRSFFWNF